MGNDNFISPTEEQKKIRAKKRLEYSIEWETNFESYVSKLKKEIRTFFRNIPKNKQKLFYSCYSNNKSLSKSIKAKCLDCCVFDMNEITNCNVLTCPLHNVRPYRK